MVKNSTADIVHKEKKRLEQKFNRLLYSKTWEFYRQRSIVQKKGLPLDKLVVNLSSKPLTEVEKNVLSKGLNFVPTKKKINFVDLVTRIELGISKEDISKANQIRRLVTASLASGKYNPKMNLTKAEFKAIRDLKKEDSLVITKADKGNVVVIMDRESYNNKVEELLRSGTYKRLNKDPTENIRRGLTTKLVNILEETREEKLHTIIKRLRFNSNFDCPQMYCLPKIHKENVPLRPVIATNRSVTRQLCKYLADILKPLTGKKVSNTKNSLYFVQEIKTIKISEEDVMVSFDVKDLFTSIPLGYCCTAVDMSVYNGMVRPTNDDNNCYTVFDELKGNRMMPLVRRECYKEFERALEALAAQVQFEQVYEDIVNLARKALSDELESERAEKTEGEPWGEAVSGIGKISDKEHAPAYVVNFYCVPAGVGANDTDDPLNKKYWDDDLFEMLLREYRIVLPVSLEEYKVGQLWNVMETSKYVTGGGEGVEVLQNEAFVNNPLIGNKFPNGQFTYKIYHLESKIPWWLRQILPSGATKLHEQAWNAFPYCRTLLTNPDYMEENFLIKVETMHLVDRGTTANAHNLSDQDLSIRQVVVVDIANDVFTKQDKSEYDPRIYKSLKTGRGPLRGGWYNNCEPYMCCYKLVTVQFKWWGVQTRAERFIQQQYNSLFRLFHRQLFCTIDKWYNLTIEDIRALELQAKSDLNEKRYVGKECGYSTEEHFMSAQ
uniref:Reverse transcriptase domain-containing protein n=1 Tax=Trichuris muris TaxID=70415 RepID=A0A5S6QDA5_TRIMR